MDEEDGGQRRRRRVRTEEGGFGCGDTTEEGEETDNNNDGRVAGDESSVVDPETLVVLKCLKPVSERKIRRELLVLTRCAALPNMARVLGIVLPDSMDHDDDDEGRGDAEEGGAKTEGKQQRAMQHSATSGTHPRRRRRSTQEQHLQKENIGSITDPSVTDAGATLAVKLERRKRPPPSVTATSSSAATAAGAATSTSATKGNGMDDGSGSDNGAPTRQLPALVLEHAGRSAQWFCHPHAAQQSTWGDNSNHLTEREIKYYTCHLLVALDGLHAAGIMHRDVKPRNMLINRLPLHEDVDDSDEGLANRHDDLDSPLWHHRRFDYKSQRYPPLPLPPPPLVLVDMGLADL